MIPAIIAMWIISAPAGYLAGDVFATKNNMGTNGQYLAWFCAFLPPMGAIIALVALTQAETNIGEIE